jgi:hypothetical protein
MNEQREMAMMEARNKIMHTTKKFIYVQFQKEGYHCFPEAATDPQFKTDDEYDVSHLAHRHMHYFYIKVWLQVTHSNRQVEFIQFRRWLENLYATQSLELNNKSCEMMAEDLYDVIARKYPGCEIRIDISEDNINGAYLEFVP